MPLRDEQLAEVASCFKLAYFGKSNTGFNDAFAATTAWAQNPNHYLVYPGSPHYPSRLSELSSAPKFLFVSGNPQALNQTSVAVVGSRRASPQGHKIAFEFSKVLALANVVVVSGLALGIDAAAHQGAIAAQIPSPSTIAVIGHGIDVPIYPKTNTSLATLIQANGCLVSEFALGSPPLPHNFPKRNRLIAALSNAVWVVEAALPSGSLITAKIGLEMGREVLATPGSILSPLSKGCHWLIRDGAKLIDSPQDILDELKLSPGQLALPLTDSISCSPAIRSMSLKSLDAMGWTAFWPDDLANQLDIDTGKTAELLLEWEGLGAVKRQPDGQYCRL
jgi:DNA processing protein